PISTYPSWGRSHSSRKKVMYLLGWRRSLRRRSSCRYSRKRGSEAIMHPQLETLLEIQDLKTQRTDLLDQSQGPNVEQELFNIDLEDVARQIDEKLVEMEESLEPGVRNRYRRLSGTRTKFIVPVINGTCFGC